MGRMHTRGYMGYYSEKLSKPTKHSAEIGESSRSKSKEFGELPAKAERDSAKAVKSSRILCEICFKRKRNCKTFAVTRCTHRFCTKCIGKHVEVQLQKRPTGIRKNPRKIRCPGLDCRGVLKIDSCRKVLPENVVLKWEDVICEAMIDVSQKFYCPYKDCSGLMVNDSTDRDAIEESECPFCHRLFCARCRVPWHSGIRCKEFKKLNKDEGGKEDLMVQELAKKKKWQRCPHCKFFVEKRSGCLHMTCRCGHQFCYACGAKWSSTHGGCQ